MKKLIVIAVIFGIYQNWDGIRNFVSGGTDSDVARDGVVLYATAWCGYCQKTRELFAENGIAYVERDIERSDLAYREFKQLGGRGVPVVNAYGTVIHGYAPQRVLTAVRSN